MVVVQKKTDYLDVACSASGCFVTSASEDVCFLSGEEGRRRLGLGLRASGVVMLNESSLVACDQEGWLWVLRGRTEWQRLAQVSGAGRCVVAADERVVWNREAKVLYAARGGIVSSVDVDGNNRVLDARIATRVSSSESITFDAARGEVVIATRDGLASSAPRVVGAARPVPRLVAPRFRPAAIEWLGPRHGATDEDREGLDEDTRAGLARAGLDEDRAGLFLAADGDRLAVVRVPGPRATADEDTLRVVAAVSTSLLGPISALTLVDPTTIVALVNRSALATFRHVDEGDLHFVSVDPLPDTCGDDYYYPTTPPPASSLTLILSEASTTMAAPQHRRALPFLVVFFALTSAAVAGRRCLARLNLRRRRRRGYDPVALDDDILHKSRSGLPAILPANKPSEPS